jgi:Ran-binding protein 1
MSDVLKPDPVDQANPAATLVHDQTSKVTSDIANKEGTTASSTDNKPITEKAAEAASSAAAAVKDNVFSMFGGGPAKVKKEEAADDVDEPSGATKKTEEVRLFLHAHCELR